MSTNKEKEHRDKLADKPLVLMWTDLFGHERSVACTDQYEARRILAKLTDSHSDHYCPSDRIYLYEQRGPAQDVFQQADAALAKTAFAQEHK